jgi:threonine/homoserine/homoserine lactone efflux protein
MGHIYAVTATNPGGVVFFAAFLPQFVDPTAPILPQFAVLGTTFVVLATVNATCYALAAGELARLLAGRTARTMLNRVAGALLIGIAAFIGLAKHLS